MKEENVYGELAAKYVNDLPEELRVDVHINDFIAGAKYMWEWIKEKKLCER